MSSPVEKSHAAQSSAAGSPAAGRPTDDEGRLRVTEAAGLRALAHPARLASIQHLARVGPATATELGEVAGLTASAMSYHLRMLERAGLISTAPSRGDGRERVWQANFSGGWAVESFEDGTAEVRAASRELLDAVLTMQELDIREWLAHGDEPGWLDNSYFITTGVVANAAEAQELGRQVSELFERYTRSRRRGEAPEDAVPMNAVLRLFPARPLPPAPE